MIEFSLFRNAMGEKSVVIVNPHIFLIENTDGNYKVKLGTLI
jgi:hypothetical protein